MKKYLLPLILILFLSFTLSGIVAEYGNTGGDITTDGDYTIHTFTENGTFVPCQSDDVDVVCRGGGGAGGGVTYTGPNSAGAGAGGCYANSTIAVTKNASLSAVVGLGYAGGYYDGDDGGDSSFNSDEVLAKGGEGGDGKDTSSLAYGGDAKAGSVGDTVYSGGDGGNGDIDGEGGGGGGQGGGSTKAGEDGSAGSGDNAGYPGNDPTCDGGWGGWGGDDVGGYTGAEYSGAGGGGGTDGTANFTGGAGANGVIVITCLTASFLADEGITWNGVTITKWNGITITIPLNTQ